MALTACARPEGTGKNTGAGTTPHASASQSVVAPVASNAAAPVPAAAVVGVRYFRSDEAGVARGWRGMTVSSSEIRMLGVKSVRVVPITELAVADRRTTFVANFEGRATRCSLDPEQAAQRFTCFGEQMPFKLRELLRPKDESDMALMEQQIKDTSAPVGICDQAELCCKAIWPLFVPGEQCDVGLQLGPSRTPDTCRKALDGFRQLSEAKKLSLPAACR